MGPLLAVASSETLADSRPVAIGSRLQLFLDDAIIERMSGVALRMHAPIPREIALTFDAPWEGSQSAYVTVFRDGDRCRMYYRGGGDLAREFTCYAESPDGIRWAKPRLGLVDFRGSKANNIIWTASARKAYGESHNFAPFKDANPGAADDARYKAVALGWHVPPDGEKKKAIVALASRDGIAWRKLREAPVFTQGAFDSQNIAFWDAGQGQYVCYFRTWPDGVRSIGRTTSTDFLDWTAPEPLDFGDSPLEHFYTNAITPYFREPTLYLGFPMRFVPERTTIGVEGRKIDGTSDAVLMSSRDGLRWSRTFLEAFLRPGLDPDTWGDAHGNNTPAWGLVPTGPYEISIYWAEHYGSTPRLRRGTLRTDGFVSVHAPYRGGDVVTRPFTFAGARLVINYSTSAVGAVRVEIQRPDGTPVPGCTLAECPEMYGDEIDRPVAWQGEANVDRLAGQAVRLRFVLKDADLFAFRFQETVAQAF